jgi:hypothetical protein
MFNTREALEASLARDFVAGASWPIEAGELAALVDMGMPDGQIAATFSVTAQEVLSLRRRLGLA